MDGPRSRALWALHDQIRRVVLRNPVGGNCDTWTNTLSRYDTCGQIPWEIVLWLPSVNVHVSVNVVSIKLKLLTFNKIQSA